MECEGLEWLQFPELRELPRAVARCIGADPVQVGGSKKDPRATRDTAAEQRALHAELQGVWERPIFSGDSLVSGASRRRRRRRRRNGSFRASPGPGQHLKLKLTGKFFAATASPLCWPRAPRKPDSPLIPRVHSRVPPARAGPAWHLWNGAAPTCPSERAGPSGPCSCSQAGPRSPGWSAPRTVPLGGSAFLPLSI